MHYNQTIVLTEAVRNLSMMSFEKMPQSAETSEKPKGFCYDFSEREVKLLAKFLRKNQDKIPGGLESFARKVELYIYSMMSIDEVEKFYT